MKTGYEELTTDDLFSVLKTNFKDRDIVDELSKRFEEQHEHLTVLNKAYYRGSVKSDILICSHWNRYYYFIFYNWCHHSLYHKRGRL